MNRYAIWLFAAAGLLLAPLNGLAQATLSDINVNASYNESEQDIPELDCVIEPSEIIDAGSSVPGLLEAIYADRSDLIREGEVIARLESSVEEVVLARARIQAEMNTFIEIREQTVNLGNITENRNKRLLEVSAISEHDMDQLATENRIAKLQVEQEKHNKDIAILDYQRAQAILNRLTIRSPVDGVVMDRYKSVGEYVEEEPVLRIAKLDPLFIEVIVPVDYLGRIRVGMQAEVMPVAAGQTPYLAVVERVDRVADAASGTYGVRLSLPNPEYAIPAGLRCKLAFLPTSAHKPMVGNAENGNIGPASVSQRY